MATRGCVAWVEPVPGRRTGSRAVRGEDMGTSVRILGRCVSNHDGVTRGRLWLPAQDYARCLSAGVPCGRRPLLADPWCRATEILRLAASQVADFGEELPTPGGTSCARIRARASTTSHPQRI